MDAKTDHEPMRRMEGPETIQRRPAPGTYYHIALALLLLLTLTALAGLVDLGPWTPVIALAIAVAKAILILLFFMHLKFSDRLFRVVAGGGVLWLCFMFSLALSDYLTRGLEGVPGK